MLNFTRSTWYCTSMSKQCIRWPVSPDRTAGLGMDPLSLSVFFKLSVDKLLLFKWSQAQVYFFLNKFEISRVHELHFQTDLRQERMIILSCLGLESSTSFYMLLIFCSIITRSSRLRPIFMLWLVEIWQVSSCRKFMEHLETCFQMTEFCVTLWCTKWNTAFIKILL